MTPAFNLPPVRTDSEGNPRRVGFELELGNLTIEQIAKEIHEHFGGDLKKASPFEMHVENSDLGKIKVERDTQMLTSLKYRDWLSNIGIDFSPGAEGEMLEKEVDKLSRWLVPCEIVTQPLGFDQFEKLNDLVAILEEQEAQGTQVAIHYAFGLHLNPSTPDLSAKILLAYIQSTLLLVDWIIQDADTDFSRRFLTSYIDPFPAAYFRTILKPDYQPGVDELMQDYLAYNDTRNRPLDMLPIFCMIDEDRVVSGVNEDERALIKGRPAFHYRLPDCRVGEEGWSIAEEWNRWNLIEEIAADDDRRLALIKAWQEEQKTFKLIPGSHWAKKVDKFLKDEGLL